MRMVDLIEKKKLGNELTDEEIKYIITNYTKGDVPDYQMAAFAMCVYFQGMANHEIAYMTEAMWHSGDVYDLSSIAGFKVDKHSSGGVGDKISLIYGPLVASFGVNVAKMSGRGLDITGGTIDKLESFPNIRLELSTKEFIEIVNEVHISIIAQSGDIVPADKKLYALRDVTSTVDSIPMIAASIMCKKLATGADGIILDVKCGNAAFMKNLTDARQLASIMVEIGKHFNRKVSAEITNMDQPLGRAIGNLIEIYEAMETLRGNGPDDLNELVCHSAAISLCQAGVFSDREKAYEAACRQLKSGVALETFKKFIVAQGGDLSVVKPNNIHDLLHTKHEYQLKADADGFVNIHNTNRLGWLSVDLGAGRAVKGEPIDHMSGIYIHAKTNEPVKKGDVVMTLYTNKDAKWDFAKIAKEIFSIEDKPIKAEPLILDIVE